jgi:ATP-dependent exoDNAse (exonuclease V) beta subunit
LVELIFDIYEIVGLNRLFSHDRNTRNVEGLMNLKLFVELADNYSKYHKNNLTKFIKYLEVLDDLGVVVESSKLIDNNSVRLMTMHAVKGLEYNTVIVSNMAEKRFPITRTRNDPLIPKELNPNLKKIILEIEGLSDKEKEKKIKEFEKESLLVEERRLGYVAFTRTKKKLILTYAKSYNSKEESTTASQFLHEINYEENPDVKLEVDDEVSSMLYAPSNSFERYKTELKRQLINSLDSEDTNSILNRALAYITSRDEKLVDYKEEILSNWSEIFNEEEHRLHLTKILEKRNGVKFDADNFTFSPTALIEYDECPKKFELSKIYQMPQRKDFDEGGSATSTGSFVHNILEEGVKEGYNTLEQFNKLVDEKQTEGIDNIDVKNLVKIFFERNKDKYNTESLVEEQMIVNIEGYKFYGIADRIDLIDSGLRIVDYKTNKKAISPKKRNWQLGFYVLAAEQKYGKKATELILEMLRLDKPYELILEGDEYKAGRAKGFKTEEVKQELIECAKKIVENYETEFKTREDDNSCMFCGYKFYCPKWSEE